MGPAKLTCFYRYNEKTQSYEYNHYEYGWKDKPEDVSINGAIWDSQKEFKVGMSITTNGIFK